MVYLKLVLLAFALLCTSSPSLSSGLGQWKDAIGSQLQESACAIHGDDVWQRVALGEMRPSHVNNGDLQPLRVRLVNCRIDKYDNSQWQAMKMTFDGERVDDDLYLFGMKGAASEVGLQIFDETGDAVVPGMPLSSYALGESLMELQYRMKLIHKNETSSDGDWQGAIRLMITYL